MRSKPGRVPHPRAECGAPPRPAVDSQGGGEPMGLLTGGAVAMDAAAGTIEPPGTRPQSSRSWGSVLVLAAWFGLVGGSLDLGMIFLKRDLFHATLYYEQ